MFKSKLAEFISTVAQGKVTYGSLLGLAICYGLEHVCGVPIPPSVYATLAGTVVVGIRRAQGRIEAAVNQIVPTDPNAPK